MNSGYQGPLLSKEGTMQDETVIREQLFKIRQTMEHVHLDEDDEDPYLLQAESILSWILGENSMGLLLEGAMNRVEAPSPPFEAATLLSTQRLFKKNGRLRASMIDSPETCQCGWAAAEAMESVGV